MPRTKKTATNRNATPSPAEYAASHADPLKTVEELLAAAKAPPRNGPTQGAAQIANAPLSRTRDPERRPPRRPRGTRARAAARTGRRSKRSRAGRVRLLSPLRLETPQLVVETALERGVDLPDRRRRLTRTRPAPRSGADGDRRDHDA